MVATYCRSGYGRSRRARIAEYEGRMPLTRAKRAIAAAYGATQKAAAYVLESLHDGEWHHVGKYAAEVAYYDTTDHRIGGFLKHIADCGGLAKYRARREAKRAERRELWLACPGPLKSWQNVRPGSAELYFRLRRLTT